MLALSFDVLNTGLDLKIKPCLRFPHVSLEDLMPDESANWR